MRMFSGAGSGLDILLFDPENYLAISSNFHTGTCREEARLDSTVTRPVSPRSTSNPQPDLHHGGP